MNKPVPFVAVMLAVVGGFSTISGTAGAAESEAGSKAYPRTVYLIRHGAYVADEKADSVAGPGLTPLGIAQARLAASRLASVPVHFDTMTSSTMTRARETADVIHQLLPDVPLERSATITECTPPAFRELDEKPAELKECADRLDMAFGERFVPARDHERSDIIVAHGNVIRYFVTKAMHIDTRNWLSMSVAHTSLTVIRINAEGAMKILSVGDVGHVPANLQSWGTDKDPQLQAAHEDRVLPSSLELERKTQPWCPGDCSVLVPFVASYKKGAERLVFVGAKHAFRPAEPTMRAVAAAFAASRPKVIILEGFPQAMGENPGPLVEAARRYGASDSDDFARSEAMYAASLALPRGIPFLGGEPTQDEQTLALKSEGFTDAELAFGSLLGWFSQAFRAGDMPDTSTESLSKVYPQLAQNVREQIHLEAPSLDAFRQHYKSAYGVDIVGDKNLPLRADSGDTTRYGQLVLASRRVRDRHLLEVIEQQLSERHSVLVVYGGGHWSTLSAALESRLGKPHVKPFLE